MIALIAAMDEQGVIGFQNRLPWHLPADLAHFKRITTGHPILMGRKTYESIGKPLPNRLNLILTRNRNYSASGCIIVSSLQETLSYLTKVQLPEINALQLFVIGGAEVYQAVFSEAEKLYLTIVHHQFVGDTYFPHFSREDWLVIEKIYHAADEKNAYAYTFLTLEKKLK